MADKQVDHIACVAVDLGTTYSGYCYSFPAEDGDSIFMNTNWGAEAGLLSYKTPTSVLTSLDAAGVHQFEAFGYEAEKRYTNRKNEPKTLYMFDKFKMKLHGLTIAIPEIQDKTRAEKAPAIDIFSMALKFMKDHFIEQMAEKGRTGSDAVEDKEAKTVDKESMKADARRLFRDKIKWIVTVPAIWSEYSKSFMRKASHKAGLITEENSDKLVIVLEPEAASLFCKELDISNFVKNESAKPSKNGRLLMPVGTVYMLVDAGGGTIDITVHEVIDENCVKELHVVNGGEWGGTNINASCVAVLEKLWGEEFIDHLQKNVSSVWWKIEKDFEQLKKSCTPASQNSVNLLGIPYKVAKDYKEMYNKNITESAKERNIPGVEINDDSNIVVSKNVVDELFRATVGKTISCLRSLFANRDKYRIKYLFMVGGFSSSEYLWLAIREAFGRYTTIMIPDEPATAIMKGASMFSQKPFFVKERLARATYGVETFAPFIPNVHAVDRKIMIDGKPECKGVFETYIQKNKPFKLGETITKTFIPHYANASLISLEMLASMKEDVKYVDEDGVNKIGDLIIPITNTDPDLYHAVDVTFYFGEPELKFTVKDTYGDSTTQLEMEKRIVFQTQ